MNQSLQVADAPRVYGMGDMCIHASNEAKLGHTAELNAHVAAENVLRQARGRPLASYPWGAVGGPRSPQIFAVFQGRHSAASGPSTPKGCILAFRAEPKA